MGPSTDTPPQTHTMSDSLSTLAQQLQVFASERDWQPFHSPKNLASALIVEAGELLEHFQWMTDEQSRQLSPEKKAQVAGEIADVLLYLIQTASAVSVDPVKAAQDKLALNALRYPVAKAHGNSKKHNEL